MVLISGGTALLKANLECNFHLRTACWLPIEILHKMATEKVCVLVSLRRFFCEFETMMLDHFINSMFLKYASKKIHYIL